MPSGGATDRMVIARKSGDFGEKGAVGRVQKDRPRGLARAIGRCASGEPEHGQNQARDGEG